MTIGVETHDPSAQAALNKNNVEATALINELKAKGVAAKDIQTSNLAVNPDYDLKGQSPGYGVSNTVTVKLRDLTNAGKIIDAAAAKVGNDIRLQGVQFSIDNTSTLIAKARADAVKDAWRRATSWPTRAASRSERSASSTTPARNCRSRRCLLRPGGEQHAVQRRLPRCPIENGTQELSVDVTVVFNIG